MNILKKYKRFIRKENERGIEVFQDINTREIGFINRQGKFEKLTEDSINDAPSDGKEYVRKDGVWVSPYKQFSAKIEGQPTGVGTTPNIIETYVDTFDNPIVGVGVGGNGLMYLQSANEFTLGKTSVFAQQVNNVGYTNIFSQNGPTFVQIRAQDATGSPTTTKFTLIVDIKVYF
jgi:hypothetical protein